MDDDDDHRWLFDPTLAHRMVLAHRCDPGSAVSCVISDVVWQDVIVLLRWATAGTGRAPDLGPGRWWRLAAGCADLLRRLPAFGDEIGEPWRPAAPQPEPASAGAERVAVATDRLVALVRSAEPLPLARLAVAIDALGAAAVSALAQESSWALPRTAS
jgi:hypothetical protein